MKRRFRITITPDHSMNEGRNWTNFRALKKWVYQQWGIDFNNDNLLFKGVSEGRQFYIAGIVDKQNKAKIL